MNAGASWLALLIYYKHLQRDKKFHYNPGRQHPEHQVKTFISLEKFYSSWKFSVLPQTAKVSFAKRRAKRVFSQLLLDQVQRVAAFVRAASRLINCKRAECII